MRSGRRLAVLLTVLCAVFGAYVSAAFARPVLFVGNLADGTVSLIDPDSFAVLRTLNVIPDGDTPQDPAQAAVYPALVKSKGVNYVQGLAVSPDGRTLYVSRGYLGDVAAFDIGSGKLLWRLEAAGVRADHIALSPDGSRLFVSAITANEVQVIDTRTHSFVGSFATGDWPHVLEFSPDDRYIFNGSLGNQLLPSGADGRKQLTIADPNTLQVVRTYQFDAGVRPFAIDPDERTVFIQLSYFNGFDEFDLETGRVVKSVDLPVTGPAAQMKKSDYPNQAAHHGIALSPDGRYVCDAGTISNYVALVARPALSIAAIIPVGDQPADAETSLDGRYCFVTNRGPGSNANTVSVISYAQRKEVARIRAGQRPQELTEAVVPDSLLPAPAIHLARPHLSAVRITPRRFTARRGTSFVLTLSRDATVTIAFERVVHGRKRGRSRGRVSFVAPGGRTVRRFTGRVGRRRLSPGHYRARVRARSADGQLSNEVTIRFAIVRR